MAGLDLAPHEELRRAGHVRAGPRRPATARRAGRARRATVIRSCQYGWNSTSSIAVAVAVVGAQHRRVLVDQPAPLLGLLAAGERPSSCSSASAQPAPARSRPGQQRRVVGDVVADQRRDLVGDLMGGGHREPPRARRMNGRSSATSSASPLVSGPTRTSAAAPTSAAAVSRGVLRRQHARLDAVGDVLGEDVGKARRNTRRSASIGGVDRLGQQRVGLPRRLEGAAGEGLEDRQDPLDQVARAVGAPLRPPATSRVTTCRNTSTTSRTCWGSAGRRCPTPRRPVRRRRRRSSRRSPARPSMAMAAASIVSRWASSRACTCRGAAVGHVKK